MKIDIEKSRVMVTPESAEEKAKIDALWRILVDCVGDSRKLVPIGEYIPHKNKFASFHIEGLETQAQPFVEVRAEEDADLYCKTCNKHLQVETGDIIPLCCGKMMEVID